VAVAIESRLPQLRDPLFGEKLVRLVRRRNAAPARPLTVVMLGSSRTWYGLKAGALEGRLAEEVGRPAVCFNFGLPGAGPVTELLTLKRLLGAGIRPDLLFVEVFPPLLAGQVPLIEVDEGHIPTDHLWRHDLPLIERYGASFRPGLRREWWQAFPFPWYSHRFAILSQLAPFLVPWDRRTDRWNRYVDPSGFREAIGEMWTPDQRRRALEENRITFSIYLNDFRLGGLPCQGLRELLTVCRSERIPTVLVLMPEGPEFHRMYPAHAWEQIQTYLEEVRREEDVPVINAREWLGEEEFWDSHHMMTHGAARFTERFGTEALLPMVRAQHSPGGQRMAGRGQDPADPPH
jgi:hypothetical protein